MNTGEKAVESKNGLLTTIACGMKGKVQYALEGSVYTGGAVIQWIRDEMRFISESRDAEYTPEKSRIPASISWFPRLPALARHIGTCTPAGASQASLAEPKGTYYTSCTRNHSLPEPRISASHGKGHRHTHDLKVDGGASRDAFLMQFQADILNRPVERPMIRESTALGAAYLAGLAVGVWGGVDEICSLWRCDSIFEPRMDAEQREKLLAGWQKAVKRSLCWAE